MDAALPELAVIGNLVYENYDASRLVDAIIREDLREEHFADAACRAAFSAITRNESAGRDRVANLRALCAASGVEFAERAIAAIDVIEPYAIARIAKVAEEGRKRLVAEAVNAALLSRANYSEAFLRNELHRIAELSQKRGGRGSLRTLNLGEFLAEAPAAIDPIIEGCFESGDKVELIAPSKCRKSFFAIDLALHIAAGKNFLALKVPRPRRVLYINLEIKSDWMKRRINNRIRGYNLNIDEIADNFSILNCRGNGEVLRENLARFVKESKVDFVVVDPRYKLMRPDENENSGEGLVGVLTLLDTVAEMNAAVMVVSHDAKGDNSAKDIRDRGAGSSWAARDTDCRFTLTPGRENPECDIILAVLPRNYPPRKAIMLHAEDAMFTWDDIDLTPHSKSAIVEAPTLTKLAELLKQCGIPMLKGTFAEHVANNFGIGINRARAMIDEALVQGLIIEGKKSRPGSKKMLGFPEWFKYRQSSLSDSVC